MARAGLRRPRRPGRRDDPLRRHLGAGDDAFLDPWLRRHPEIWAAWLRHEADLAPPGGESNLQFHARAIGALQALAKAHRGQRIAVVTHGGVLDMLWRTVHGLPLSGARSCQIPNTGLNRVQWDGARLKIIDWADASHLEGLPAN